MNQEKTKQNPEKKNWKGKVLLAALLAVLVAGAAITYFVFTQKPTEGMKSITIEVISDRDNFSSLEKYTADQEFLGDFLVDSRIVTPQDSEYGRYILAVMDMSADEEQKYWWSIKTDGEMSVTGMDEIVITDGSSYTLTLEQGY